MKKLLFIVVALFAFGLWVMFSPPEDGGYMLIAFGSKTFEMSLWFAALVYIVSILVIWLAARLLFGSFYIVRNFSEYMSFGGSERAQKRTASGLVDYIEGNWLQARKKLLRAAPKVDAPLINYLAAARSAYELGDRAEAEKLLTIASETGPDAELAVALTRARMELSSKQYDQCLMTLLRIKGKAPQNPVLLDLLCEVYIARQDWDSLHGIIDRLRSYKIRSPEDLAQLELTIHRERLKKIGEEVRLLLQGDRLPKLRAAWERVPAYLQKDNDMIDVYARQLAINFEDQEAESLVRKALSKEWHPGLVHLYGRLRGRDPRQQLTTAEAWLKQHPRDAVLLLTLGRLCLRNEIWGSSRDYFNESLRIKRDPETFAELARLLESLGETQRSSDYYQQALGMAALGLPELPQPKTRV